MDKDLVEKLAKLPKWARDHITSLEHLNSNLVKRVQVLEGSEKFEGTNVFVRSGFNTVPLPAGARVIFKTGEDSTDYIEFGMNVPHDLSGISTRPKAVQVRTGSGAVIVIPSARNVVHIDQSYEF